MTRRHIIWKSENIMLKIFYIENNKFYTIINLNTQLLTYDYYMQFFKERIRTFWYPRRV